MVTQSFKNRFLSITPLFIVPFLMTGCLFGENKQFFETASVSALGVSDGAASGSASGSADGSSSGTSSGSTDTSTGTGTITGTSTGTSTGTGTSTSTGTSSGTGTGTGTSSGTGTGTGTSSTTPTPTPCTAGTTTESLRIMFMVDNSGSTATTDPTHNYRTKTVQNFLASYGTHTNLTYSFGYFSGTTAQGWDMGQSKFMHPASTAFGNSAGLSSALTKYETISPSGNTPYSAAFTALQNEVQADELSGVKQNYVVVFMSDGMPTDISGNIDTGIIAMVDQLRTKVQANGTSLLTVSSVYFGPESDSVSISHLQNMANEGQGQFVDTNLQSSLVINDLISVPGNCAP